METETRFQVKDVAALAGVSVRTLHYYEQLGLLVASDRSPAGYRLYSSDDLLRLQQVLIHRELGLPLEQIRRLLDDPAFDRRGALARQRALLSERVRASRAAMASIDAALDLLDNPKEASVSIEDIFEGHDQARYEQEVRERWGDTDAYKEAARRSAGYTEDDLRQGKAESNDIEADAARLLAEGVDPTDDRAMNVAERHRHHIDRWHYSCDHNFHLGLAAMYESDARFRGHYDSRAEGLAAFLVAAIRANAQRQMASS